MQGYVILHPEKRGQEGGGDGGGFIRPGAFIRINMVIITKQGPFQKKEYPRTGLETY